MTEALQRQLANDEPKCANCRYWAAPMVDTHVGPCARVYAAPPVYTTDLTVCSKWERKPNAQTEAEQAQ